MEVIFLPLWGRCREAIEGCRSHYETFKRDVAKRQRGVGLITKLLKEMSRSDRGVSHTEHKKKGHAIACPFSINSFKLY
jgi:hypothetical protein